MKFTFDPLSYNYPSRRSVVYGRKGMVATGNPLAAQVGLDILKKGGNAIDAAIATAVALTVVEPSCNGIGGDNFAIVWYEGKMYGLNSSGPSPKDISIEALKERGFDKIPTLGVIPATVPGAPAGWVELWRRFGNIKNFKDLFKGGIEYGREGFILQTGVGGPWHKSYDKFSRELEKDIAFKPWFDTFAPSGKCLKTGDLLQLKEHASTLEEIGETEGESFYRGSLARKIDEFYRAHGGYLRYEDLANFKPQWVEPISTEYKGFEVHELPPNGQGIIVLMALNILKNLDYDDKNSSDSIHKQIEAMKLAFIDAEKYLSDPRTMDVSLGDLLSEKYGKERAKLIKEKAIIPEAGQPVKGGTVYLSTADKYGNMVSLIQSNYMGFGSGIVIPGTGISMHNRGDNFNMDPKSPNCIEGNKLPYHTIIPGFLTKDGNPVGPFGVMGGFMQPQGHLQLLLNTIDYNLNPQDALDRPRWQWVGNKTVEVEQGFDNNTALELMRRGHDILVKADSGSFGRGQAIWKDENGVLCGGTESRTDGTIAVW